MKSKLNFKLLVSLVVVPMLVTAHPGHGNTDGYTIIHYFTEPMHAITLVGSIVLFYGLSYLVGKKKSHSQK